MMGHYGEPRRGTLLPATTPWMRTNTDRHTKDKVHYVHSHPTLDWLLFYASTYQLCIGVLHADGDSDDGRY